MGLGLEITIKQLHVAYIGEIKPWVPSWLTRLRLKTKPFDWIGAEKSQLWPFAFTLAKLFDNGQRALSPYVKIWARFLNEARWKLSDWRLRVTDTNAVTFLYRLQTKHLTGLKTVKANAFRLNFFAPFEIF